MLGDVLHRKIIHHKGVYQREGTERHKHELPCGGRWRHGNPAFAIEMRTSQTKEGLRCGQCQRQDHCKVTNFN